MRSSLFSILHASWIVVGSVIAAGTSAAAQSDAGSGMDFSGAWALETDSGMKAYMIVKDKEKAVMFYADRNDHTIHPGEWGVYGDALFVEWRRGSTYMIRAIDGQNFRIAVFNGGYTGTESPDDVGIARPVPATARRRTTPAPMRRTGSSPKSRRSASTTSPGSRTSSRKSG